jgi:translocation and assembly module TamB
MGIELGMKKGVTTTFQIEGDVSKLFSKPELDLKARLVPTDLAVLSALSPKIERATGQLEGALTMTGPLSAPLTRGEIKLSGGSLQLQGAPLALEDVTMIARVDEREVRIVQASARAGTGLVTLSARAPLRGFEIGEMTARLDATDLRLPVVDGVDMAIDASLNATWSPSQGDGPKKLPQVTGSVIIDNFLYTRPIKVSADLDSLARRGRRTEVDVYDPDDDVIEFNIAVRPRQAMVFRNNLLEAEVKLETEELILSGTNQRFGMRGGLRVEKGGRIRLRANEFDIRQGTIRFEDPTRISPRVDLTATTDYRRYTTSATSSSAPGATSTGGAGAGVTGSAGGSWRISLHAYGDADDLKVDLTSEPGLPQDDIVLLLTVGLTRAELDQLQASNLGSTAALEALSTLSGADSAVKTALPIIDDFRFSSAYSPRTGRTEPTVTVGKRISDRVRANVTSGLSENRDIRSNVEWRLSPETSVLGNYDNLNDVTSQGLGNLGADFRIRLEF